MDIQRPSNARAKKIRRIVYGTAALLLLGGVTYGLSKLRPAAPSVDRATIWPDEVKRGPMVVERRGLGTLVPEDIRWIAAQTDSRVDRWVLRPGAIVKPDSIIMELSDPTLQREALDAEYQLKGAEADYANLKVQVDSDLMNQKAAEAAVRSDYEQARLQHEVDEQLYKEGIGSEHTRNLSKVREDQLAIRLKLESERTAVAADSAKARLAAQQAKIDEQKALYQLKKSQVDALHVRAGINGVLQLVPVDVGQHVTPGTNLARVDEQKKLKAEIKIAETQAKDVLPGQKATIDTRNGVVTGHVSRVDPSVVNGTVTVDVTITDPLPNGARPDLSVDGSVELENLKDVLYVGRPVHGQADSTIGIFKIIDDGSEAVRVNVKLGRSSVNTIEVVQGLKVGDKVILSDMSAWDNFDRVRLKSWHCCSLRAIRDLTVSAPGKRSGWALSEDGKMHTLLQDVRYGLRMLAKNPGFTCIAILTLALGIGANTAIFSLLNQILLRRLPVRNPGELVILKSPGPKRGHVWSDGDDSEICCDPLYKGLAKKAAVFDGVIARYQFAASIASHGQTERGSGELVTGNYFDVLGVRPDLGRVLSPTDDDVQGAHPVVVLSHSYWMRHFGGDAGVLNQAILVNNTEMTIVGVAQAGFGGVQVGQTPDIFVPMNMKGQMTPIRNGLDEWNDSFLAVLARLKPGVSMEQAQAGSNIDYPG